MPVAAASIGRGHDASDCDDEDEDPSTANAEVVVEISSASEKEQEPLGWSAHTEPISNCPAHPSGELAKHLTVEQEKDFRETIECFSKMRRKLRVEEDCQDLGRRDEIDRRRRGGKEEESHKRQREGESDPTAEDGDDDDDFTGMEPVPFAAKELANSSANSVGQPLRNVEKQLNDKELEETYGVGSRMMKAMGFENGASLSGRPDALKTCLRATRHAAGQGIGFKSKPLDVWRTKFFAPICTSCKERSWPASMSRKETWHCGFCKPPPFGRPRCLSCGTVSWDGWNAPRIAGRGWWCFQCWCDYPEHGSEAWMAWFQHRRERFPDAFQDGGPELLPKDKKRCPSQTSEDLSDA